MIGGVLLSTMVKAHTFLLNVVCVATRSQITRFIGFFFKFLNFVSKISSILFTVFD